MVIKDQHFMTDKKVISRIVSLGKIKPKEEILEIGAGSGNLTEALIKTKANITAIEIDKSLSEELGKRFLGKTNLKIISGNALNYLKKESINKIVANIPYAICESLIQILFFKDFKRVVLTIPRKFSSRLTEGETKFSFYSDIFFEIRTHADVPREAFSPKPRTDSVIISIERKKRSLMISVLEKQSMVLKNSLRESYCEIKGLTKNQARVRIAGMGLDNILEKKVSELGLRELLVLKNNI